MNRTATCALLLFIIGYICVKGIPGISWQFLTTEESVLNDTVGILPAIYNTLFVIFVSLIIVLPLGVGAAIYLTEYAASGRLVRIIEFAAETLTGIPSIIFGLVGMMLFVQKLGLQAGILAGGLTLVLCRLPGGRSITSRIGNGSGSGIGSGCKSPWDHCRHGDGKG